MSAPSRRPIPISCSSLVSTIQTIILILLFASCIGSETSTPAVPRRHRHSASCREPRDLSQQFMDWFSEANSDPTILAQMPNQRYWTFDEDDQQRIQDELICNAPPSTTPDSSVMDRALCPWEWRVNRDDERQPRLMSEARCRCRSARGNVAALCVPIHREFPVLRRVWCDKRTHRYTYVRGYETIAVGCHSVMPPTRTAAPFDQEVHRYLWRTKVNDRTEHDDT